MSNNTMGALFLAGICLFFALTIWFTPIPDCRRDEVMVRGMWGPVCAKGHG